jgi:uncharacterized NAD(P)/FAD-binding protein YdhS
VLYPRRSDFGAYMRAQLEHAAQNSISSFQHVQDRASGIESANGKYCVSLASGAHLEAHACIVATGHERPMPPAFISPQAAASPRYINDPWNLNALAAIDPRWNVLLIGTALTAADVVATLSRREHAGSVTAISRHGYAPAGQNPSRSPRSLWEAVNDPLPDFVLRHGKPARVSELMRILRANIAEQMSQGRTWHSAFDEVRNAARHLWSALPVDEKRRFQRHVRPRYDPHRFRIPPQTERVVSDRRARGQLTFVAGRISSIDALGTSLEVVYRERKGAQTSRKRFDAVINCTGPEIDVRRSQNPLLRSLLNTGLACEGEAGIGVAVNDNCQALARNAQPVPGLYFIGPLTRGLFGETPAVPLITWEVLTLVPHLLAHS